MSVKILQREGLVVPISGKICDNCKADYESNYATKPGEKIVIIMPKAQLPVTKPALAIPSPFATSPVPPQPTSVLDQTATKPSPPNLPSPKSPNLDMSCSRYLSITFSTHINDGRWKHRMLRYVHRKVSKSLTIFHKITKINLKGRHTAKFQD